MTPSPGRSTPAGVYAYKKPSARRVTEPCAAGPWAVTLIDEPVSLPSTPGAGPVTVDPAATVSESSAAVGPGGFTVTVIVELSLFPVLSVTVYGTTAVPVNPGGGV